MRLRLCDASLGSSKEDQLSTEFQISSDEFEEYYVHTDLISIGFPMREFKVSRASHLASRLASLETTF